MKQVIKFSCQGSQQNENEIINPAQGNFWSSLNASKKNSRKFQVQNFITNSKKFNKTKCLSIVKFDHEYLSVGRK